MFRLISLLACSSVERHSQKAQGGRLAAESQSAPCHVSVGVTLECGCVGVWESGTHYIRAPAKSTTRASTPKPRARGPPPPSTRNRASCPTAATHVRGNSPLHVRFFLERQGGGADTNCIIKVRPCRIRYRTPLPQVNGQALPHRKQNRTDAQSTGVHRLTRRARAPPSL